MNCAKCSSTLQSKEGILRKELDMLVLVLAIEGGQKKMEIGVKAGLFEQPLLM